MLGTPEAKVIEILDTEQPTVKGHRADSFIHVDILGKEAIMHFEFQTRDSTQLPIKPCDFGWFNIRLSYHS